MTCVPGAQTSGARVHAPETGLSAAWFLMEISSNVTPRMLISLARVLFLCVVVSCFSLKCFKHKKQQCGHQIQDHIEHTACLRIFASKRDFIARFKLARLVKFKSRRASE